MARELRTESSHRFQIDPRNIHDYTTPSLHVTAEPTDPYARPVASPGLRRLVESLSSVNAGLQTYAGALRQQYDEDLEEGGLLYATGQELPEEPRSLGIIHGYERLKGLTTANTEYRARAAEYFSEHAESASPEEFFAGLSELSREFLEGASESFVSTFAPQALQIEEQYYNRYVEHNIKRIREQSIEMIHQIAYDTVRGQIGTLLGSFADEEFENLADDPSFRLRFNDMNGVEVTKQALREALSATQEEALKMGLNRNDVSEIFLNAVGTLAVELAMPELLEFTKEKDESGISLEGSSLGDVVRRYRDLAEQSRVHQEQAQARIAEEERRQRVDNLLRNSYYDLGLMALLDDRKEAAKIARVYRQKMEMPGSEYHELSPAQFNDILQKLITIEQHELSFADIGNETLYFALRTDATFMRLDLEELMDAIASGQLTLTQANTLMDMYHEQEERREQDQWQWPDKAEIERLRNVHINLLSGDQNLLGGPLDQERHAAVVSAFDLQLEEFRNKNERNPTKAEWYKYIAEPVYARFGRNLNDVLFTYHEPGAVDWSRLEPPKEKEPGFFENLTRWFTGKPKEQTSGKWTYRSPTEAHYITSAVFRNNTSWTKQDVIDEFIRNGESPEAAEAYVMSYAFLEAGNWVASEEYQRNPIEASRTFVRGMQEEFGYTLEEAYEALDAGRQLYQEGKVPNR